jgi:DNA-binding transcriptional MerR regulator
MKSPIIPLLVLLSFSLSCGRQGAARLAQTAEVNQTTNTNEVKTFAVAEQPAARLAGQAKPQSQLDTVNDEIIPLERKIVRDADITIEVASTSDAQHRVTSIAEAHGGFVVTSESKQRESVDPSQRTLDFKLVVRIPFDQFGVSLEEIRRLASNVPEEKTNGQDVTEEFIDLEARIKTQKALELQFMQIMRQAAKVEDALEVQRQLAEVRTEIEKLEGRKRFLENRSSLATITVNIQAPKPAIATTPTGFRRHLSEAVSDSIDLGSEMVIFFARMLILMVPLVVLFGVPSMLVVRYLLRRAKRMRLARQLATPATN